MQRRRSPDDCWSWAQGGPRPARGSGNGRHARNEENLGMYDYVIVGAGSAGCVLANRLSEDPDTTVLLVDAGGPDTNHLIPVPAAFPALFRTAQDWDYSTGYEPYCNNRRVFLPRGKVLGGSSSINSMIYIRGNRRDYDEWRALGCDGWGWESLLPYFV